MVHTIVCNFGTTGLARVWLAAGVCSTAGLWVGEGVGDGVVTGFGVANCVPPEIFTSMGAEAKPLAITRSVDGPFSIFELSIKLNVERTSGLIDVVLMSKLLA